MEEKKEEKKMDMASPNPENYKNLLENTSISENNNSIKNGRSKTRAKNGHNSK